MKKFVVEFFNTQWYRPIGFRFEAEINEEVFLSLESQIHEAVCGGLISYIKVHNIKMDKDGLNGAFLGPDACHSEHSWEIDVYELIPQKSILDDPRWEKHSTQSRGTLTGKHLADIGLHKTAVRMLEDDYDIWEQIHCDSEEQMKKIKEGYSKDFPWKKNPYKD